MQFSPVNTAERAKLDIRSGDTVRVWQKIVEKGKTRLQAFEGLVISRKHGTEPGATFTVRKVASGVGTERIFPLYSPNIEKIEIVRRAKVRRSKLYYIREKTAKSIRRKMKGLRDFVPVSFDEREASQAVSTESSGETNPNPEEEQHREEGTTEAAQESAQDNQNNQDNQADEEAQNNESEEEKEPTEEETK